MSAPSSEGGAPQGERDPQALAAAVASALCERDRALSSLGIALEEARPGYARLKMRVRAEMVNAHGTCHGGFLFLLADAAFELACNSHGAVALAAGAGIEFVAPALEGDELVAEATERVLAGRSGVYDVQVTRAGEPVACFRGRSAVRRERVLDLP